MAQTAYSQGPAGSDVRVRVPLPLTLNESEREPTGGTAQILQRGHGWRAGSGEMAVAAPSECDYADALRLQRPSAPAAPAHVEPLERLSRGSDMTRRAVKLPHIGTDDEQLGDPQRGLGGASEFKRSADDRPAHCPSRFLPQEPELESLALFPGFTPPGLFQ